MRKLLVVVAACGVLVACGNTYHPEYHPVTVTQTSQSLSYPVTVNNGGSAAERSPVVIAPATPGVVISQPAAPVMPAMPAPPSPPTPPSGWPN